MNQEPPKPKLIIKNPLATPPNTEQAMPAIKSPAAPTGDIDPVIHLGNELHRVSSRLEILTSAIKEIHAREKPATQSQVEALVKKVQEGVRFDLNSQDIAQLLLPELEKQTKKAVTQIEQATQEAVNKMSYHYGWEAKKWNAKIGFTSWKSAAAILVTTLTICSGSIWYAATQYERSNEMQAKVTKSEADSEFNNRYFNWIYEKYPKVWQIYKAKLDQEAKANSTKK